MRLLYLLPLFAILACNSHRKTNKEDTNDAEETEAAFEQLLKEIEEEDVVDEGPKPIEPTIVFGSYCGF